MPRLCTTVWLVCELLLAATCSEAGPPDFERDVAPLLSARCLRCHGVAGPEAGLSLASRDGAFKRLESGRPAIAAQRPEESGLLQRVMSAAPDERMPPQGEPLSQAQIELLRQWIAAGADWPDHWAYRPLRAAAPPTDAADSDWVRSPVDAFISARLREVALAPSPEADRRTLIRRLTIDLWGLPPTPGDVAEFLADGRPDAVERLVDRLLASPRYGERQARHWMDLVHYAETHGNDQDRPRESAWPYRDYLIDAFNADLPYARFVAEQVAGDIVAPEDSRALTATGFLSAGPWDESSLRDIREDTLDREIARYLDRDDIVTTVMTTFTSTTVQCARCHDHKFDPIPQADYYALQAVFADTGKGNRVFDADPAIARRRRELQQGLAALPGRLQAEDPALLEPELQAAVTTWSNSLSTAVRRWQPAELKSWKAENGSELMLQADGSLLASGPRPEVETYKVTFAAPTSRLTGVMLEVLTDPSLPMQGPGRQDNGNLHLNEVVLWQIVPGEPAGRKKLEFASAEADFDQAGWTIAHAIDGNPATAWGIHPQVGQNHRAAFRLKEPLDLPPDALLQLELQQTHGRQHLIGRARISATAEPDARLSDEERLPADVRQALLKMSADRTAADQRRLAAAWLEQRETAALAALPAQQRVFCGSNQFEPDGSFRPTAQTRKVQVLHRGDIMQPRADATPGSLSLLNFSAARFPATETTTDGERRAALAGWLTSPDNVLTWRSIVNRSWQQRFGRGLVDTASDFGKMGASPSHPELLDALALDLLAHDGSLKRLHRQLVCSAAWRQSSQIRPDAALADADNRWIWRMHRSRMDAETIRDAALVLADVLDDTLGGPSVRQFVQTPGVAVTPNVDYAGFDVDSSALLRRSVYRFLFRTIPDPFMDALDCPDASQLTPKRGESLTALQALATLNDKVLVRHGERIAELLQRENDSIDAQTDAVFARILLRAPAVEERTAAADYARKHGLANLVRVLLNSNEFLFVD
ncbi:PSD1 and planctomycete cytochrome C domain-containing protein [Planctellipticum variicoloris]|uniref:PSD1 and planctomycete cytochrome C domain-containing protein n=1 Tax=Planctellipticum variicoloris TaxID=3064265 RepID=UPI003013406E|nr:PSD1 and planctomycete cytochrome C domain-containing protein [Planctomycetaceae bacterium SH412]